MAESEARTSRRKDLRFQKNAREETRKRGREAWGYGGKNSKTSEADMVTPERPLRERGDVSRGFPLMGRAQPLRERPDLLPKLYETVIFKVLAISSKRRRKNSKKRSS